MSFCNRKNLLPLIIISVITFTTCKKRDEVFSGYFFASMNEGTRSLQLYVNDKLIGHLPFLNTRLSPDNDTVRNQALLVKLNPGKHLITAKDSLGNILSEGVLKIKSNSIKGSSKKGGQATSHNGSSFAYRLTN